MLEAGEKEGLFPRAAGEKRNSLPLPGNFLAQCGLRLTQAPEGQPGFANETSPALARRYLAGQFDRR